MFITLQWKAGYLIALLKPQNSYVWQIPRISVHLYKFIRSIIKRQPPAGRSLCCCFTTLPAARCTPIYLLFPLLTAQLPYMLFYFVSTIYKYQKLITTVLLTFENIRLVCAARPARRAAAMMNKAL